MPKQNQRNLSGKVAIKRTRKIDRISSLPDSLLCHILSFLPTIEAKATGVLSRRWRHLWKEVPVLYFEDDPFNRPGFSDDEIEECFVDFVDNVVAQHKVPHVEKFKLECSVCGEDTLTRWISSAVGPHLKELDLCLCIYRDDYPETCDLPQSVFTCASLESLALKYRIYLYSLPDVCLPSLKNLELDTIYVNPEKVLSGCPVLENLKLILEAFPLNPGINYPAIHMPHSLKRLTFADKSREDSLKLLEVDTPYLEYLDIKLQGHYLNVLFSHFTNMVEAQLDIYPQDKHLDWIPELLKALRSTERLVLKLDTTTCLLRAPALNYPEFCRLHNLVIDIPCSNSAFLINLIQHCPILRVLIIYNQKGGYFCSEKHSEPSSWTPPANHPICVTSNLMILGFSGYRDSADERAFIAYILQKGLVLAIMKVLINVELRPKKTYTIRKKLSTLPRGSKTVHLIIK
ncbi:FBD-associated F-box protein At5g56370-like isoform X1 [Arachis stenosperma]|uniref:FBD-associated F-box protein At5g56370-like isoform X1 n=1 Tax=Arachis stenosperma TaxID=217475 RepID=UPI0025AD2197|nr:FBD-associated F-box protein At5g56370-like isoform X1 [Arachis stenosperma]